MKATHLQVEYLTTPLGLDIVKPRFYWNCEGGKTQRAYRIKVEAEPELKAAVEGSGLLWDSGKVESASMTHIPYEGRELKSRERIVWSVCLWDEADRQGEWSSSRFEMGLLEQRDWVAGWISGDYKPKKNRRYPVDHFKKTFSLTGEIKKARLYVSACGLYEARINEKRVGDFVMAPGCTDYRKRLSYQTYDVTALLNRRDNSLELELADGWYRGSLGCFGQTHVYGRVTKLICQLELVFTDGSKETILSDGSFDWSNDGPVRVSDIKDGEIYEAGMLPSYSGKAAEVAEDKSLVASNTVSVKEKEHFTATLLTTPSGKKVLDFGQNIAGFLSFQVKGEKGAQIRLLMGEILDTDGEFTQKNFQAQKPVREFGKGKEVLLILGFADKLKKTQPTPKQEILFTCSGKTDSYKTSYAVFGFRYVLIETDVEFRQEDFEAIAVYSDLEMTGEFTCSSEKVNRLYQNTLWSMKGNFLDIPTDCPTRERLGWTGDAQVFFNTGAYYMNTAPFFRKWMQDMADGILKSGVVPAVVPYAALDMMYNNTAGSAGWGDAAVLLPYRYWKRYGDCLVMEEYYDKIARPYAMFMLAHTGHSDKKEAQANPLNAFVYEKGRHLGDWLEPEEFQDKITAGSKIKQTETATAYFHYSMTLMAEMAQALGRNKDAESFLKNAQGSKKAYEALFLQNGAPDTDRQAKLVRPLALGLAEGSLKKAMEKRLAAAVEHREYRIGTGFLSTPFILSVLTEAGYTDMAYKMLENEEAPGWLYEVNQGATTVWEDWEGSVSHNHYSPGAVCQWLFDTVAGIRPAGENHFIIAPSPGGTLTEAHGSYHSLYGKITSGWKQEGEQTVYRISVPGNVTAELILPDGERKELSCGDYCYSVSR